MAKHRLIDLMIDRGLSTDRDQARKWILSGAVQVNGHKMVQPAAFIGSEVDIRLNRQEPDVSRAGRKLDFALTRWHIPVENVVAADVGAASGGFTECLLRRGALRVYAIETGKGQLAWKIREDERVVVMEETNILKLESLPDPIDMVTIDVSWTPLRRALPALVSILSDRSTVVALLKPNYELQDPAQLVDGVLKNHQVRKRVVEDFMLWAEDNDWDVLHEIQSPVTGDRGNVEWLLHLQRRMQQP